MLENNKKVVLMGDSKYQKEMIELSNMLSSSGHLVFMPIMLDKFMGESFPFDDIEEKTIENFYLWQVGDLIKETDYLHIYNPDGGYPKYFFEALSTIVLKQDIMKEEIIDINKEGVMDFLVKPDFDERIEFYHPGYGATIILKMDPKEGGN